MERADIHSNWNRGARRVFAVAVCAAAIVAASAGLLTTPPQEVPSYALNSEAVYRCEVTLAAVLAAYLLIASIALAFEGRTVGKVSTSGIELPTELSSSVTTQQEMTAWLVQLHQRLAERDERLYRDLDFFTEEPTNSTDGGTRRRE